MPLPQVDTNLPWAFEHHCPKHVVVVVVVVMGGCVSAHWPTGAYRRAAYDTTWAFPGYPEARSLAILLPEATGPSADESPPAKHQTFSSTSAQPQLNGQWKSAIRRPALPKSDLTPWTKSPSKCYSCSPTLVTEFIHGLDVFRCEYKPVILNNVAKC